MEPSVAATQPTAGERSRSRLTSGIRAAVFRGKRRGAELADRNPVAERAMRVFLGARTRWRRRAAARARLTTPTLRRRALQG